MKKTRTASVKKKMRRRKKRKEFYKELSKELILTLLVVLFLFFLCSKVVFSLPENEGYGMLNTLTDGDRVYVNRFGEPKRFSLIYFNQPDGNGTSVRRVIGVGGEHVRYVNDELYIDDRLVIERFLLKELSQAEIDDDIVTKDFDSIDIQGVENGLIPKGKYLVLGDNRRYATDSRYYGLVDEKEIIGTVVLP